MAVIFDNETKLMTSSEQPEVTTYSDYVGARAEMFMLASRMLAYRVGEGIQLYYLPLMTLVGTVGNALSLLVMLRKQNRSISVCIYMATLAVSDCFPMAIGYWYWLRRDAPIQFPTEMQQWECEAMVFCGQFGMLTGTITICVMTFDRVIAIIFPLKAKRWCTPRRARITVPIIWIISALCNLPYIRVSLLLSQNICVAFQIETPWSGLYYWFITTVNCFLPFAFLLVANSAIIFAIRKRGRYLKQHGEEHAPDAGNQKENQLTFMLLLVTFTFLALQLPVYTRYIYYVIVPNDTSAKTYADYILAVHVTNKLSMSNSAVNFFLYCIGGSRFRSEVRELLCCTARNHQRSPGTSVSNTTLNSEGGDFNKF